MKYQILLTVISFSFFACKPSGAVSQTEAESKTEVATTSYQDIGVADFKSKIGGGNVVLLDVRTPEEVAGGKIEGAVELDFYSDGFAEKIKAMDKGKTYLVYCKSGGRSGKTCKTMQEAGFKSVFNLDGGWTAWSAGN